MSEIINFEKFKRGKYKRKQTMTLQDCIQELDQMIPNPNTTERQQTALSVGIKFIIEYMRGADDLK